MLPAKLPDLAMWLKRSVGQISKLGPHKVDKGRGDHQRPGRRLGHAQFDKAGRSQSPGSPAQAKLRGASEAVGGTQNNLGGGDPDRTGDPRLMSSIGSTPKPAKTAET